MLDYRDRREVEEVSIRELVKYLESEGIKKQYLETINKFGIVEQEVYPVEVVSQEKMEWYFRGIREFWVKKGVEVSTSYHKEHVLKVRMYYS